MGDSSRFSFKIVVSPLLFFVKKDGSGALQLEAENILKI